jgi:hypothetical protein
MFSIVLVFYTIRLFFSKMESILEILVNFDSNFIMSLNYWNLTLIGT